MSFYVPSFSQSLMNVAVACCLKRLRNKCMCDWSTGCDCRLNIANYIEGGYTNAQLQLFMLQAEQQAHIADIPRQNMWWGLRVFLICVLVLVGIITCNLQMPKYYSKAPMQDVPAEIIYEPSIYTSKS